MKKQLLKNFPTSLRQSLLVCIAILLGSVSCFRPEANLRSDSQSNAQDSDQSIVNQAATDSCSETKSSSLKIMAACRPKDEGEGVPGFLTDNFKAITITKTNSSIVISSIANSVEAVDSGDIKAVNLVFVETNQASLNAALADGSIKPEVSGTIVGTTHPKFDGSFSIELAQSMAEVLIIRAGGRTDDSTVTVAPSSRPGRYHGVFKVYALDGTFAPMEAKEPSLPQNSSNTYWIFVSKEVHDGKFTDTTQESGLAGMDRFCQDIGPTSVQGTAVTTWKAVAGDQNTDLVSHLDLPASFSIKLVDNSVITSDGENFFSQTSTLPRSISFDQNGNLAQFTVAWTGVASTPNSKEGKACQNWSDNGSSSANIGEFGNPAAINMRWLQSGFSLCSALRHVYCLGH